jgi:hypothetical protein
METPIHRNACTLATVHAYSTSCELRMRQADDKHGMRVVALMSCTLTRQPYVVVAFDRGVATGLVPLSSLPDGAIYLA